MSDIVRQDLTQLIDQWLDQERNGVQRPVPLHNHWDIAGHKKKQDAYSLLESVLEEGLDYLRSNVKNPGGRGRPSIAYYVSCDGLKHWSMSAQSENGRLIRQYFIEAEKKWKLTQQIDPAFANQIELLKIQADIAKSNASLMENQRFIIERSEAIASVHGLQGLALIQGRPDAVVEKIEKITETIVCRDGMNVSFEGKSVAQLGKELGFKTGKQFELWLERNGGSHLICEGMRAIQSPYIPTENIKVVKRLWADAKSRNGRQLLLGEGSN